MKTEKEIITRIIELKHWFDNAARIPLYTEAERAKDRIEALEWVLSEGKEE